MDTIDRFIREQYNPQRRLNHIVTRCGFFGTDADNYTSPDCQSFGLTRQVMWEGDRSYTAIRLCRTHLAVIEGPAFTGLVKRVKR